MLHPKKLSRAQKIFLEENGLDPKEFWLERTCPDCYVFIQKSNGATLTIRR